MVEQTSSPSMNNGKPAADLEEIQQPPGKSANIVSPTNISSNPRLFNHTNLSLITSMEDFAETNQLNKLTIYIYINKAGH